MLLLTHRIELIISQNVYLLLSNLKTSLTLPLEFTKMERELVTKGTASRCCFEIKVKSVSVRFLSPLRQIYPSVIQNYRSWVIYLVIKNKMQFLIFNASF